MYLTFKYFTFDIQMVANMPRKRAETVAMNMRIPKNMLEGIDLAIELGQGSNRTDIIKTAIANYLRELSVTSEMKKRKL